MSMSKSRSGFNDDLQPYRAGISVTFDGAAPFVGTVYNKGDGNHAVFDWPAQTNTEATTELAEFRTQTKWVTNADGCTRGKFTDPDPKFVGMVSHAGYQRVSSDDRRNVYSADGITCTYDLDDKGRELISSIAFQGAVVDFKDVIIGPQDPSRFEPPGDCGPGD